MCGGAVRGTSRIGHYKSCNSCLSHYRGGSLPCVPGSQTGGGGGGGHMHWLVREVPQELDKVIHDV